MNESRLYDLFFSQNRTDVLKAIKAVRLMQFGKQIPPVVEATYHLARSLFEPQLMELALVKFVSIFADAKQIGVQPNMRLPVAEILLQIGVPPFIADVRNQIAHSLTIDKFALKMACKEAFKYCQQQFSSFLSEPLPEPSTPNQLLHLLQRALALNQLTDLKEFLRILNLYKPDFQKQQKEISAYEFVLRGAHFLLLNKFSSREELQKLFEAEEVEMLQETDFYGTIKQFLLQLDQLVVVSNVFKVCLQKQVEVLEPQFKVVEVAGGVWSRQDVCLGFDQSIHRFGLKLKEGEENRREKVKVVDEEITVISKE